MTLVDIIAVLILGVSAFIGFVRGATREVMTVLAFVLAALLAVFALRLTGPLARHMIHPDWAANAAAVVIVFVAAYIALRILGAGLTRRIHNTEALGTVDRTIGVGFGLIRGLVLLGVFNLVFNLATPPERVPHWISGAALYPLSGACATALRAMAPEGSAMADRFGPAIEKAVKDGASDDAGSPERASNDQAAEKSPYDDKSRKAMDEMVEKSRR